MKLIDKLTFYKTENLYIGQIGEAKKIKTASQYMCLGYHKLPKVIIARKYKSSISYYDGYIDILTYEHFIPLDTMDHLSCFYHFFDLESSYKKPNLLFEPDQTLLMDFSKDMKKRYISKDKVKKIIKNTEKYLVKEKN